MVSTSNDGAAVVASDSAALTSACSVSVPVMHLAPWLLHWHSRAMTMLLSCVLCRVICELDRELMAACECRNCRTRLKAASPYLNLTSLGRQISHTKHRSVCGALYMQASSLVGGNTAHAWHLRPDEHMNVCEEPSPGRCLDVVWSLRSTLSRHCQPRLSRLF